MANDKILKEIAEKLQNHTSEVNPQMWQAVSSQIGAGATGSGAAGASAFGAGKVAAIIVGVAAIGVVSYFAVTSQSSNQSLKNTNKVVQKQDIKTETNSIEPNKEDNQPNIASNDVSQDVKINDEVKVQPTETNLDRDAFPKLDPRNTTEISIPLVTEPVRTIPKTNETSDNGNTPNKETAEVKDNTNEPSTSGSASNSQNSSFGISKLPNTFSPNGDGIHDKFYVESKGLTNYSLVVLDKANNKVWQTTDPSAKWDGRDFSGQLVPAGDYIYFVAADGPDGEKVGKYQRLTIHL